MNRQRIYLCECTARDGFQHEADFVPTDQKVALIDRFTRLGFPRIEVTSFSHLAYVPQFADAEEVFTRIQKDPSVVYKATCVNTKAIERAIAARSVGAGPDEVSFPISATDAHNMVNTRKTIEQSKALLKEISEMLPTDISLTATVTAAYSCPFTGPTPVEAVEALVGYFTSVGVQRVIIGDSSGYAYPPHVEGLFSRLVKVFPDVTFVAHFHDNRGAAMSDVLAAIDCGVDHFDCSFGGLGGHPAKIKYAEGITGNVTTEDLACMLEAMGFDTGLDMADLVPTALEVERVVGRQLYGRVTRAGAPWETLEAPDMSVPLRS